MEKKIKVGIIGVGNISGMHIEAYQKIPNVELYAFCDIDPVQLKKMGERYGVTRLYEDRAEMLALPELDAVSICTWNSSHAECAIDALNAGKHVLCEKPMATSLEDAIVMEETAKKNGKVLMIGFVRRFGDDIKILKDFDETGYFGDLYYGKATYLRRNGNPGGWFGDKSRSGGGPLIDLGVHVIDFIRYAMGNPKAVSVYGAKFEKLGDRLNLKTPKGYYSVSHTEDDICDVEDFASALIRFDNGAVISVEASFSLNIKENVTRLELMGTKGGAAMTPSLELFSEYNGYMVDSAPIARTDTPFDLLFGREMAHFIECIEKGTPCISPAEDGVEMMRILTAIYESAKTGHEVIL